MSKKYVINIKNREGEWQEIPAIIGPKGDKGDRGKSAYELWLDTEPAGSHSMQDFFNSLKGPKGEPGNDGRQGIDGRQGQKGSDGKSSYQSWKEKTTDTDKSEEAFVNYLKGDNAFTVWKKETSNLNATFEDYKNAIKGDTPTKLELKELMKQYWEDNIIYLTITEYNNLTTKDPNKLYFIVAR